MGHPKMVCQLVEHHATDFLLQLVFIRTVTQFQCRLIDHNDMPGTTRGRESLRPVNPSKFRILDALLALPSFSFPSP
jgi:hypothetical protein